MNQESNSKKAKIVKKTLYFLAPFAAIIGTVVPLYFCPSAQATPNLHDASLFCTWVHNDPTPRGVYNAVGQFVIQGVSQQDSVDTIVFALTYVCPEYAALVSSTAKAVSPRKGWAI